MAVSRREFLKASSLFALQSGTAEPGVLVNDIHSQLNPTRVREVVAVSSPADIQRALRSAAASGHVISIAGGRHAMGAQQFAESSLMLDMTRVNRVRSLDRAKGIVDVEAGIMWPALVDHLLTSQEGRLTPVGYCAEADGRGSTDDRRSAGGKCPWARLDDEAVHQRRRIVRARRRARKCSDLQPYGERGAVPPGHRGLWAVRCHLDSETAAHPAAENSAGGRGPDRSTTCRRHSSSASRRGSCSAISSFRSMRHPTTFSGRASSPVTGRSIRRRRCPRAARARGRGLARAAAARPQQQIDGIRPVLEVLPVHVGTAVLV